MNDHSACYAQPPVGIGVFFQPQFNLSLKPNNEMHFNFQIIISQYLIIFYIMEIKDQNPMGNTFKTYVTPDFSG